MKTLDGRVLRGWPLPALADDADKEERGRILVLAGSREIPGAAVLAATAALRAGAGKLVIATGASAAMQMAFAMPEARVIALPETSGGGFSLAGVDLLDRCLASVDGAVIGPGLMDEAATCALVTAVLPRLSGRPVVLDALAMCVLRAGGRLDETAAVTPHAGEMAHLTGATKDEVLADPAAAALAAARRWNAIVALKGAVTFIATPAGTLWRHEGGSCGLATSGSGDTLAGAIAGLAARGAGLEQACAWGVAAHALAGEELSARLGPVGFLAREIPGGILAALNALQRG